jgi:hypothetical protein
VAGGDDLGGGRAWQGVAVFGGDISRLARGVRPFPNLTDEHRMPIHLPLPKAETRKPLEKGECFVPWTHPGKEAGSGQSRF